jgi:hypothetical protein
MIRVINRYMLGDFIKSFLITPRADVRDVHRRGGAGDRLHVARHLGAADHEDLRPEHPVHAVVRDPDERADDGAAAFRAVVGRRGDHGAEGLAG